MHVCHAIYRLGFDKYMKPIATELGFTSLAMNFPLKLWSKHDEFLLMFAEATMVWLRGI